MVFGFFPRKIKINEDNEKIGRVVCATQRGPPAVKKTKQKISESHSQIRFNSGAARSGMRGKEKNARRIEKIGLALGRRTVACVVRPAAG